MRISVMQPHFMPYPGLFNLIAHCDKFVFYLDAKFELQSWQCRNRIRTDTGWKFLTVPVRNGKTPQIIRDVEISYEKDWITTHLKTLKQYYGKVHYFKKYYELIEQIYVRKYVRLYDLNIAFIRLFMACLDIHTEFAHSDHNPSFQKLNATEKLALICDEHDADIYISSVGGQKLYTKEAFKKHGIDLKWMIYPDYEYTQLKTRARDFFIPELSILDMLFNCGPKSKDFIYLQ